MWALIDNYDSFSWILHDYLLQTGNDCRVFRNDEITVAELEQLRPDRIILSPGPGTPAEAGICMEVIDRFHPTTPILGICLGHQAIGMYFGSLLKHAPYPMHGKTTMVSHRGHPIFKDIPTPFQVMRYHSLIIDGCDDTDLSVLAVANDDGSIMALGHRTHHCIGIQFHPESIGTPAGLKMLSNWASI